MPSPRPDKALRRLIAELATASPGDVQEILAGLDFKQRQIAGRLLIEYSGQSDPTPHESPAQEFPAPLLVIDGLSTWLGRRLVTTVAAKGTRPMLVGPAGEMNLQMTSGAMETLRSCAEDLVAVGTLRRASDKVPQSRSGTGIGRFFPVLRRRA
jgi:hypothetical protein